jgi:hypothetical protein
VAHFPELSQVSHLFLFPDNQLIALLKQQPAESIPAEQKSASGTALDPCDGMPVAPGT